MQTCDDAIQQIVIDEDHDGKWKYDTVKLLPNEVVADAIKTCYVLHVYSYLITCTSLLYRNYTEYSYVVVQV